MFSSLKTVASLVLALDLVLAVPTWRRNNFPSHSDWDSKNLESYYKFKVRYHNLGCADVQGTDFYQKCCVPLPKGQDPPEECGSSCPASASYTPPPPTATETPAPPPTETHDGSGDGECEDDGEDDSNLPYCDELGGDHGDSSISSILNIPSITLTTPPEQTTTTTTTTEPEPTSSAPGNGGDNGNNNGGDNGSNNGGDNGSNNGGDNGDSGVKTTGFATFYEQDGSEGACGGFNTDNDLIGAMDTRRYGDTSVVSSVCGRRVHITNKNNGKSVEIVIRDACPTCENEDSIDLSPAAFNTIATPVEGMVPISWYFLS